MLLWMKQQKRRNPDMFYGLVYAAAALSILIALIGLNDAGVIGEGTPTFWSMASVGSAFGVIEFWYLFRVFVYD